MTNHTKPRKFNSKNLYFYDYGVTNVIDDDKFDLLNVEDSVIILSTVHNGVTVFYLT